jgi:hypothetical protein
MSIINNYTKAHMMCAFVLFSIYCKGQNLVPNYSFEQHTVACANIAVGGGGATDWISPVINPRFLYTYCNACTSNTCCGVPFNTVSYGYQYAHTGVAYAGVTATVQDNLPQDDNLRDYLQAKLLDTLRANKSYYIAFFMNLDNYYYLATNNVGLLVGDTAIQYYNNLFTPANPQILQYGNPLIIDTFVWVRVGGVYKAHGGEQYITIGNFNDNANTDTVSIDNNNNAGGYFIDDVSVIPLDSMQLKADAGRDTTINKGDSVFIGSRLCGLTNVVWYDSAGAVIDTGAPGFWVSPAASTYYIITQNVNGFYSADTVYITVLNPLPVSITNYQLRITDEVVNSWQTATELNTSYFMVQRSLDGKTFTDIGTVKAVGSGANSYQFIDESPAEGTDYYRLKSVDKDGKFSYSKVLSISLSNNNYQLSIVPNPARDYFTVENSNLKEILVIDELGRMVIDRKVTGTNISISLGNLSSGLYLVKGLKNDNSIVTGKLIKQ